MHKSSKRSDVIAIAAILTFLASPAIAQGTSSPTDAQATQMVNHALALIRANRNDEAAAELKQVVQMVPSSAKAHHSFGLALAKVGDNQSAISEFKTAISLNPDLDAAWLTLGGLYQSVGKLDDALATYNEFLKRFDNPKLRPDLTTACTNVKNLAKGLEAEQQRLKVARDQTAQLRKGYLAGESSTLLNAPAQSDSDDYIPEATRQGHIYRWTKMPIKVYIADAKGVPGYKPAWGAILKQSFHDWERGSGGKVKFEFVDEFAEPFNGIRFTWVAVRGDKTNLQGLTNEAEAGEAVMYTLNGTDLVSGEVKVLTQPLSTVLPLTDNRIRFACLHEIGHALGLSGHTDNPEDIMFLSTSFKDEWRELSGRDSRTIQRFYSEK